MVTASDAKVANWVCAALSITILVARFAITRYRDKRFNLASWVVALSVAILSSRITVVYLYLVYGTSNDVLSGKKSYFNASDLHKIETGSVLTVVSRILITTFYWLQVCLLLLFYSALVRDFHWRNTVNICWALIAGTYVAVVLASVLECRPFKLYWQIKPPPGRCVRAYVQLYVQGISNIALDLLLLALSFPLLQIRKRNWSERIRVGLLFILGCFTMIVTSVRIAYIEGQDSYQPVRSFWASIQMVTCTFVANVPTIYGCFQVIKRKKSEQRTRQGSRPELWVPLNESPTHSDRGATTPSIDKVSTNEAGAVDEKAWSRHVS